MSSLVIKKAVIWKSGNSYVVTIPKAYIKNGQLQEGQEIEATFG